MAYRQLGEDVGKAPLGQQSVDDRAQHNTKLAQEYLIALARLDGGRRRLLCGRWLGLKRREEQLLGLVACVELALQQHEALLNVVKQPSKEKSRRVLAGRRELQRVALFEPAWELVWQRVDRNQRGCKLCNTALP